MWSENITDNIRKDNTGRKEGKKPAAARKTYLKATKYIKQEYRDAVK